MAKDKKILVYNADQETDFLEKHILGKTITGVHCCSEHGLVLTINDQYRMTVPPEAQVLWERRTVN